FKADQYAPGVRAPHAYQIGGKPFLFSPLMPGAYLVVFDENQNANARDPFPTAFYPNAAKNEEATGIHFSGGLQVLKPGRHLPQPVQTRPLRVVLDWNGHNRNQYSLLGIHPAPAAQIFQARRLAEDTYEVDVLTNHTYRIQASAGCGNNRPFSALRTEYVTVD